MDDEGVEVGSALGDLGRRGALKVFLFIFSCLWVLVLEDKVDLDLSMSDSSQTRPSIAYLVRSTALVGAKHDDIWRSVGELVLV